jgi:mannose-6-phosphate isomerase
VRLITPRLVPRVWGGDRLKRIVGAELAHQASTGEPIGEAWFGDITDQRPLVKLLDVQDRLSVQVHPDDALAAELSGASAIGKHEAWVILDAEPGAYLLLGRDSAANAEQISAALSSGADIAPLLARIPVEAGDALDVPPGTLHALMPGLLVWEVQQPSDLTYRVSDWGRQHPERPLHLREARRATDPIATVKRLNGIDWARAGIQSIVENDAFHVRAVVGPWNGELKTPRGATLTLITRSGSAAQAQVGDTELHALQVALCEASSASLDIPSDAALLVADPGRGA